MEEYRRVAIRRKGHIYIVIYPIGKELRAIRELKSWTDNPDLDFNTLQASLLSSAIHERKKPVRELSSLI